MKNIFLKLIIVMGVFMVSSCEFDQLDNPNAPTPDGADAGLLLNSIQTGFAGMYSGLEDRGSRVTRIHHQASDTWAVAFPQVNMNDFWPYAGLLQNIQTVKKLATDRNLKRHLGIAKTLEAYILMSLVDTYGDVPYSKAFDPNEFNPARDSGADVYKVALDLLVSALADFSDINSVGTPRDFYLNNDYTKWAKVNRAFQLKYHLNRRLIDANGSRAAINALITAGLPAVGDEFVFRYGTSLQDPFTRHPSYVPQGGGDYMSNYFMFAVVESKASEPGNSSTSADPRGWYYFYRQRTANPTSEAEARCVNEFPPAHYGLTDVFCMPGKRGYWGRDHLDPQGVPPDGPVRTVYGLYPAGGTFDNNTGGSMNPTSNAGSVGAGIQAIMLPAYVDFMLAEAASTLGTTGDAKALMTSGVTKHINFVRSWSLSTNQAARIRAFIDDARHTADRDRYLAAVAKDYDDAASKMDIIGREYWLSCFGAGHEAYNLYRRTGTPKNLQKAVNAPNPGKFPRTFLYPGNHVERNNSAPQKADLGVKVFWDNNPDNFIF